MSDVRFIEVRVTEGREVQGPVHASDMVKVLAVVEGMRDNAANKRLYPTDITVVPWDDGKIRVQFERAYDSVGDE